MEEAEKWLLRLPDLEKKEIILLIKMLEKLGYELQFPHARQLKGTKEKIKELRCMRYGNRLYYVHHKKKIYVGLLGGDKGTQDRDIKKADKLARKLKNL
ncbi:type II toxin-antitoxin system RelE/ParE family toxin [Thiotrichales bacterium 19S9-12]|nr:type II toxin-antitoxin system RelE/ParE family toxin [Thiotrichales bacterium 19S9-11]MCF6811765.1 type II toxin-antitoxin system RelE/ParE family toxin [Thiotrichales bacterium 19S9-12]